MSLEHLLKNRADIWRGRGDSPSAEPRSPTGLAALDERIGGGWPVGALTEILLDRHGVGELSLLTPALARLPEGRWQAWVDPPHVPYAPALSAAGIDLARLLWVRARSPADTLWAVEQALRSGVCAAVLGWPAEASARNLRRLQLAAEHGAAMGFLFRSRREARHPSPAALRLLLEPAGEGLQVHVVKRRGGRPPAPVVFPRTIQ